MFTMPRSEQGVDVSLNRNRYTAIPRTLCFITRGRDEVLLLRGAPAKRIWPNTYNGIGGHVERDEDILASVVREVQEETGLTVKDMSLRGVINVDAGDAVGIIVFVFSAEYVTGEPISSAEGRLEWVRRDQLASRSLVEDLPAMIPRILDAAPNALPFFARTRYDSDDRLVIRFAENEQE
ncbi:MAG: NUDIX hydrolase [Anaerolineae bacterium]